VPWASHDIFIRLDAIANSMATPGDGNLAGSHPLVTAGIRDHLLRVWPM
jgi:hypothetical protein